MTSSPPPTAPIVDLTGLLAPEGEDGGGGGGQQNGAEEEGRLRTNAKAVRCNRCDSAILPVGKGVYEERPFALFLPQQKKDLTAENMQKETLTQFYRVDDMFDFDNVGFSKSVGDVQFLLCADCEVGPIGYSDKDTRKCYVALARVKHAD